MCLYSWYFTNNKKKKQNLGSRMPVSILPGSCAGDTPYGLEESPLVHNFHNLKKKICLGVWEGGDSVSKHLLCKHEDRSLDPQQPCKKLGTAVCTNNGEVERGGSQSHGFQERL